MFMLLNRAAKRELAIGLMSVISPATGWAQDIQQFKMDCGASLRRLASSKPV
jgi:hypothetical protein